MSDQSQGNGWWLASDGKWYPPETHPDYNPPVQPGYLAPEGLGNFNQNHSQQQQTQFYQPQSSNYNNPNSYPNYPNPQQSWPYPGQANQTYQPYGLPQGFQNQEYQQNAYNNQNAAPDKTDRSKRKKLTRAIIAVGIILIILVATAIVGLETNNSNSPVDPVNTFLTATNAKNYSKACSAFPKNYYNQCMTRFSQLNSQATMTLTVHAGNYVISGNLAIVTIVGKTCYSVGSTHTCDANSNPNAGLPTKGQSFAAAWNFDVYSSTPVPYLPCIRINGTWYLDYGAMTATPSNSGSGSVSSYSRPIS